MTTTSSRDLRRETAHGTPPSWLSSHRGAMGEIHADEHGGGRTERMHAALFARTVRALGLDDGYGHSVDEVPAVTLAGSDAVSTSGLDRRLLGAVVGHLAALEMTSSLPSRRYGQGTRRLGQGGDATWSFDEHVAAAEPTWSAAGRPGAPRCAARGTVGELLTPRPTSQRRRLAGTARPGEG